MITVSPAVHSVRQEFMEGKPMIIFKKSKTEKVDFFKQPYDGVTMRGALPEDTKIIYQAVQNGEKLTVDRYGHVYTSDGRWIAEVVGR